MDYDFVSHAVSNFYGDKRRFSASLLTQKRSVSSSPSNFCFSVSCFNQGIVTVIENQKFGGAGDGVAWFPKKDLWRAMEVDLSVFGASAN